MPADCSIMTPANRPSINSCRLRQRIQLCFDSFYAYYNGIPTGTQAICAHIILFMHIFVCLIMHYHTFSIIKLLFSQYVPKPVCRFLRNPLSCFYIQLQQTVSVFKRIDGGHIINKYRTRRDTHDSDSLLPLLSAHTADVQKGSRFDNHRQCFPARFGSAPHVQYRYRFH